MTTSANPSGVSLDDVRHVADLANLELTAEELPRMAHDLNAILGHIAQLQELDTAGIEPMAQVGEVTVGHKSDIPGHESSPLKRVAGVVEELAATLRADVIQPSLDRAAVMAEAPETDGRFFKVPKVIER
jgi:aspartyl-tRNA(Asn)/glutamyl-tRNA(Gln) amidotransferase subunit C